MELEERRMESPITRMIQKKRTIMFEKLHLNFVEENESRTVIHNNFSYEKVGLVSNC
jgi:hypothetical protein